MNAPPRGAGTRGHRVATTTPQNGRLCSRSVRAPTKGGPVARARSHSGSGQQGLGAPSVGQWPTGSARTGRHARGPAGTAVAKDDATRAPGGRALQRRRWIGGGEHRQPARGAQPGRQQLRAKSAGPRQRARGHGGSWNAVPATIWRAGKSPVARVRHGSLTVFFLKRPVVSRHKIAGHKIVFEMSCVSMSCSGVKMKICKGPARSPSIFYKGNSLYSRVFFFRAYTRALRFCSSQGCTQHGEFAHSKVCFRRHYGALLNFGHAADGTVCPNYCGPLRPSLDDGLSACTHACQPMRALRSNHG